MTKRKITGMKSLQREKARLAQQIEKEQAEILHDIEALKEQLWPLRVFSRFRKTAESISENKFILFGAQFVYAVLQSTWKKKKPETETESGIVDFLRQVADNFISLYVKKEKTDEQK
jgi:hypothetical protein